MQINKIPIFSACFVQFSKEIDRDQGQLQRDSHDTVRLLQALVDLSSFKIINSRVIDLTNINATTLIDGRKTMTCVAGRLDKTMTVM